MNRETIMPRLSGVFRDVFDEDSIVITAQTTANDIDEWDSIAHISLIAAVEAEFGLRFSMKEVSGMKNVGEMLEILESRATK